jgi:hypothetical protein
MLPALPAAGVRVVSVWKTLSGSIRQRAGLRSTGQIWCRSAAPLLKDFSDLPAQ